MVTTSVAAPHDEAQGERIATRLNWLRAGVMGANDGIVSTAGLVVGVAGAAVNDTALLVSGVAATVAGAMSMAVGEYISVSSQRDAQQAELAVERGQLAREPEAELAQLTVLVQEQGIDGPLAREVAVQLTERDALAAHARLELGIDPDELTSPWHAAWASMIAFVFGALVPLLAIVLTPRALAVQLTGVSVVAALALTGYVSAHLGGAPKAPAVLRTVGGGVAAMAITYAIGVALGTQI
jgi:VIT1/CCC1 family predicted Fe2+/Mn2+ transporter